MIDFRQVDARAGISRSVIDGTVPVFRKEFLGDAYHRFEVTTVSTVVRIKSVKQLAA